MRLLDEKRDKIESLTLRYVLGDLSECVFQVSLMGLLPKDEIRHLIMLNQIAHRNSMSYRRGNIS